MSSLVNFFYPLDMHSMRSGSRTFLVVLLAVTVTCIVVLQVNLDTWAVDGFFNLQFNVTDDGKDGVQTSVPNYVGILDKNVVVFTSTVTSSAPVLVPKVPYAPTIIETNASNAFRREVHFSKKGIRINVPLVAASRSRLLEVPDMKRNYTNFAKGKLSHAAFEKKQAALRQIMKRNEILRRNEIHQRRGDPLLALQRMSTISPEKVTRVFLLTYFRSGSSFIGDLLQQNWKTFYQFEPFHYMAYDSRITENRTEEAFALLNAIYRCNFTDFEYYLDWVKQPRNKFLFANSLFLWFSCRTHAEMCFTPEFISAVCRRALYQVVKAPRLSMNQMRRFLDENSDLNIKLIYLSRDPRGILSSRWSLDWCNSSKSCSDPKLLCDEMKEDSAIFDHMHKSNPSKFIKIRYEDIVKNPNEETLKLFKFLNLPFSPTVQRYLKSHTVARKAEDQNPYSTRRNSSSMAYSWRQRINLQQISTIQSSCSAVIQGLNFSFITADDVEHSIDSSNHPLLGENHAAISLIKVKGSVLSTNITKHTEVNTQITGRNKSLSKELYKNKSFSTKNHNIKQGNR